MHANPGIDERGVQYILSRGSRARSRGMLQKNFEILMPRGSIWCNLRLDARLETIIWPFLD